MGLKWLGFHVILRVEWLKLYSNRRVNLLKVIKARYLYKNRRQESAPATITSNEPCKEFEC